MELQFATVVPVLHETTGASGFIVMISSFMKIRIMISVIMIIIVNMIIMKIRKIRMTIKIIVLIPGGMS